MRQTKGGNVSKPVCKLVGENGNVFNLIGLTTRALNKAGLRDQAEEFSKKVWECGSYEEALALMARYVEVV